MVIRLDRASRLYKALIRACVPLVLVIAFSSIASAQPENPQFRLGRFTVFVEPASINVDGHGLSSGQWPHTRPPFNFEGRVFSGKGRIYIKNIPIAVTFDNVKIKLDTERHFLVAIAGSAIGTSDSPSGQVCAYDMDSYHVTIDSESTRLTTNSATAGAKVKLTSASFFVPSSADAIAMTSARCEVAPDGSIYGSIFQSSSSFKLRDSVYKLELSQTDEQVVCLGPTFSNQQLTSGCKLKGIASRDEIKLFSFDGSVAPSGKSGKFTLTLTALEERYPEPDYVLKLNSGVVYYEYNSFGLSVCKGLFKDADLQLPAAVLDENGHRISLRIDLQTDKSGSLFNGVSIPMKLRAGFSNADSLRPSVFKIEPARNSSWIYLPLWYRPNKNSSYPMISGYQKVSDVNPSCEDLLSFLETPISQTNPENAHRRPGLTILQGVIYFKAPQAKVTHPLTTPYSLKTSFWGALTLTPWGITGGLTSQSASFVPSDHEIGDATTPTPSPQFTWQQILQKRNERPQEPKERFLLAELKILEMRINRMRFCINALLDSVFRYNVHFPWPSYIDLELEDVSLNKDGLFKEALGPISSTYLAIVDTQTQTPVTDLTSTPTSVKPVDMPNPDTHILWAWRLPVSFSDRGVKIKLPSAGAATINVSMKDPNPQHPEVEIMSSEIWLRPLYSKSSLIKKGVRFSADMTPKGMFSLTKWDTTPYFAKMYALPGTELSTGFDCQLGSVPENGIKLAGIDTLPADRPFDHIWSGKIHFPFFDWLSSSFSIKDLQEKKLSPTSLPSKDNPKWCCQVTWQPDGQSINNYSRCDGQAVNSTTIKEGLRAKVDVLNYSYDSGAFTGYSPNAIVWDIDANGVSTTAQPGNLLMTSFTNANITLDSRRTEPYLDMSQINSPNDCDGTRTVKNRLKDAINSQFIKDLINYDYEAVKYRGICDEGCTRSYWTGTYQLVIIKNGQEKIVLSCPNAKYFDQCSPVRLDVNASQMALQSDEDDSKATVVNIPGAQLYFKNGGLYGSFGATYTPVATELPYEGEFRFFIDTGCGYFYMLGAGSFTYYVTFHGTTLIVHAPYKVLKNDSPPGGDLMGVTSLLEDIGLRSLSLSEKDFKMNTGLMDASGNELPDETIITGAFTTGGASFSKGIDGFSVNLAASSSSYLFQFKPPDGSPARWRVGGFFIAEAGADMYVISATGGCLFNIAYEVRDTTSLAGIVGNSELSMKGQLWLSACGSAYIGHCEACLVCSGTYSTKSGFNLHIDTLRAHCAGGDCDSCNH